MSEHRKSRCFACKRDVLGGELVKVQDGIGSDGGSLHLQCWTDLIGNVHDLRSVIQRAHTYLTTGSMDRSERTLMVARLLESVLEPVPNDRIET